MNVRKILITIFVLSIITLLGCSNTPSINKTKDSPATQNKTLFELQNTSSLNQKPQEDFTNICPSETATNCKHVSAGLKQSSNGCKGSGTVSLISPMNLDDIGIIIPMGAVIGGHVTPIDHMYFQPTVFQSQPDTYNVYADADGVIESIGVEPAFPENKHTKIRLVIYHTCNFYSIYNLLTSLSPKILSITGHLNPGDYSSKKIPVKQGELLGKIGGQTLDLSVNYDAVTLKGFIVPDHYKGEEFKLHTVDPFDYFSDTVRISLLAKDVRQAEPRGGKIDYDIDGKLVGNWFVENTNGYSGSKNPNGYWITHASFVYDDIDPSHVVISLGNYEGQPMQFGVKGNSPDPKDVSFSMGLVKYDLAGSDYILGNGQNWNRMTFANDVKAVSNKEIEGVLLVQLVSDRKLKLEAFPHKTSDQVSGFDSSAVTYER